jgi:YcxB-like protein
MDEVVVRGVLLQDADRALPKSYWPQINRNAALRFAFIGFAVTAPIAFLCSALDPGFNQVLVAALLVGVGIFGWLWAASAGWRSYIKINAATATGAEADDWFIDTERVRTVSPSLTMEAPWRAFADVRETDRLFHFILTPALIFALPKRSLSDESSERLRALIAAARERGDVKGIAR